MSDFKHQMYPAAGMYQANPSVVPHQAVPNVATHQAHPPIGIYQDPPAIYTMTVTEPQQTFEAFDRKKVKVFSIILVIFGCLLSLLLSSILIVTGVLGILLSLWLSFFPIVAGVLGILSSQQPSQVKIAAFMVLSIITIIISIICALIMALYIIWGNYIQSEFEYDILYIVDIFGVIFNVIQTVISLYCSILASRQVGCCGCGTQNQQSGGVVHGKVHQPVANVGQYQQYQLLASNLPPYSHATQQP